MAEILILGSGGHAQVVGDILIQARRAEGTYELIGFLDDDSALVGSKILGKPVLGTLSQLDDFTHEAIIIGIGENKVRTRVFEEVKAQKENVINAIHPDAVLASNVKLGEGVVICAGVVVNTGTIIGDNVILNTGCTVDHHSCLDDHVHIAPGVHLGGEVKIGDGALIGIGATVMPQRQVGAWSVVGAGGVVNTDLGNKVVATGVPARVIRKLEENK